MESKDIVIDFFNESKDKLNLKEENRDGFLELMNDPNGRLEVFNLSKDKLGLSSFEVFEDVLGYKEKSEGGDENTLEEPEDVDNNVILTNNKTEGLKKEIGVQSVTATVAPETDGTLEEPSIEQQNLSLENKEESKEGTKEVKSKKKLHIEKIKNIAKGLDSGLLKIKDLQIFTANNTDRYGYVNRGDGSGQIELTKFEYDNLIEGKDPYTSGIDEVKEEIKPFRVTQEEVSMDEEDLVPILTERLKGKNFKVVKAIPGADGIKITNTVTNQEEVFSIDAFTDKGDIEYVNKINKWVEGQEKYSKGLSEQKTIEEEKKKKIDDYYDGLSLEEKGAIDLKIAEKLYETKPDGNIDRTKQLPTEKEKEAEEEKRKIVENLDAFGRLGIGLNIGTQQAEIGISSIPESIYNVFAIPQNFLAYLIDDPTLETSATRFKEKYKITNAALESYKKEKDRLGEISKSYDINTYENQGIMESISNGEWLDAFAQIGNGLAESAPVSISIMAGSGMTTLPQLIGGSTLALMGPEVIEQEEKNPDQNPLFATVKGMGLAAAETFFSAINAKSITFVYKDILLREGKKIAETTLRRGLLEMYQAALKIYGFPVSALGEGFEEILTLQTQNIINGRPLNEGVTDAFILGLSGGGFYGAPINAINFANKVPGLISDNEVSNKLKNGGFPSTYDALSNDKEVTKNVVDIINVENSIPAIDNKLDKEVSNNNITEEESESAKKKARQIQGVLNSLKSLGLNDAQTLIATNLIIEKSNLEDTIKKVGDSALTNKESDRIKEINEELSNIRTKTPEELSQERLEESLEKEVVDGVDSVVSEDIVTKEDVNIYTSNTPQKYGSYAAGDGSGRVQITEEEYNALPDTLDDVTAATESTTTDEITEITKATGGEVNVPTTRQQKVFRAGDLVDKAETIYKFDGPRSTGHFGTGFYFFGKKEDAQKYAKRTGTDTTSRIVSEVDLDGYNLAPASIALHKALKNINDEYSSFEFLKRNLNSEVRSYEIEKVARTLGIDLPSDLSSKYAEDITKKLRSSNNKESASTIVMKELGFDGVDATGTELDNSTYGTVVYDIKPQTRQQKAQDDFTIQDVIEDDVEEALVEEEIDMGESTKRFVPRWLNNRIEPIRIALQDKWYSLSKLQKIAARDGYINPKDDLTNIYLEKELEAGIVKQRIQNIIETIEGSKTFQGNSTFERMYKDGVDIDQLGLYMFAKHAPERNTYLKNKIFKELESLEKKKEKAELNKNDGIADEIQAEINAMNSDINSGKLNTEGLSGMTNEQAEAIIEEVSKDKLTEKFDEYPKELREKLVDASLQLKVDYGLISESEAKALSNDWEFYVPLYVDEDSFEGGNYRSSTGKKGKGLYKLKGSDFYGVDKRVNPITGMIVQATAAAKKAQANQVFNAAFNLATKLNEENVTNIFGKPRKATGDDKSIKSQGKAYVGYVDGVETAIEIKDEKIQKALEDKVYTPSEFVKKVMFANNYLRMVNTLINPEFQLTNFVRDVQTAFINISAEDASKMNAKMLKNVPNAMKGIFTNELGISNKWSDIYQDLKESGGDVSWVQVLDMEAIKNRVNKAAESYKKSKTERNLKLLLKAGEQIFQATTKSTEMASRLSAYRVALDAGYTKKQASSLAKNLTVNFEKKGTSGVFINTAYLFANAGIQGSTLLLRAMTKSGAGGNRARTIAGAIIGLSIMNSYINKQMGLSDEDKEEDKTPEYTYLAPFIKNSNMVFMTPEVDKDGNYKASEVTIPLPYGYNVLWSIGQNAADVMDGTVDFEEGLKNTTESFLAAFNPRGASPLMQQLTPTFLQPIAQNETNQDWMGNPLYPERVNRLKSQSYYKSASEASKITANYINSLTGGSSVEAGWMDLSPEVLDNTGSFAIGGLGRFIKQTYNFANDFISGEKIDLNKTPFVRKVYKLSYENKYLSYIYKYLEDPMSKNEKQKKAFKDALSAYEKKEKEKIMEKYPTGDRGDEIDRVTEEEDLEDKIIGFERTKYLAEKKLYWEKEFKSMTTKNKLIELTYVGITDDDGNSFELESWNNLQRYRKDEIIRDYSETNAKESWKSKFDYKEEENKIPKTSSFGIK